MPEVFSGVNGGGVFGTWCSFRYEVYPFFSGRPLLQLPVFVGMPPAPATRSQGKDEYRFNFLLESREEIYKIYMFISKRMFHSDYVSGLIRICFIQN